MKQYLYKGKLYNARELSELCGIKYTTLIERLNRGYTVEEAVRFEVKIPNSVLEFDNASDYRDWEGMIMSELYHVYWNWCRKHGYTPESNVHFSRNIKRLHSNIRIVPTRVKQYDGISYKRVIRVDYYI